MTDLTKPVTRKTSAAIHEKGQRRPVLVTLIPPAKVGVRLAGTRQTYSVDVEAVYSIAVKMHLADVEKRAKQIAKNEGLKIRSARAKARKELAKKLCRGLGFYTGQLQPWSGKPKSSEDCAACYKAAAKRFAKKENADKK